MSAHLYCSFRAPVCLGLGPKAVAVKDETEQIEAGQYWEVKYVTQAEV